MQLSSIENITEDNIVFHNAKKHKVPNSKTKYERIKIEKKLPNVKLIYSGDNKKFSTIFKVKGNKEVKPLEYKDKYFNTRMAIVFESI